MSTSVLREPAARWRAIREAFAFVCFEIDGIVGLAGTEQIDEFDE
jgi:hypothetical protein